MLPCTSAMNGSRLTAPLCSGNRPFPRFRRVGRVLVSGSANDEPTTAVKPIKPIRPVFPVSGAPDDGSPSAQVGTLDVTETLGVSGQASGNANGGGSEKAGDAAGGTLESNGNGGSSELPQEEETISFSFEVLQGESPPAVTIAPPSQPDGVSGPNRPPAAPKAAANGNGNDAGGEGRTLELLSQLDARGDQRSQTDSDGRSLVEELNEMFDKTALSEGDEVPFKSNDFQNSNWQSGTWTKPKQGGPGKNKGQGVGAKGLLLDDEDLPEVKQVPVKPSLSGPPSKGPPRAPPKQWPIKKFSPKIPVKSVPAPPSKATLDTDAPISPASPNGKLDLATTRSSSPEKNSTSGDNLTPQPMNPSVAGVSPTMEAPKKPSARPSSKPLSTIGKPIVSSTRSQPDQQMDPEAHLAEGIAPQSAKATELSQDAEMRTTATAAPLESSSSPTPLKAPPPMSPAHPAKFKPRVDTHRAQIPPPTNSIETKPEGKAPPPKQALAAGPSLRKAPTQVQPAGTAPKVLEQLRQKRIKMKQKAKREQGSAPLQATEVPAAGDNRKNQPNRRQTRRKNQSREGQFGGVSAEKRRKARQQRQERRQARVVTQEREEIIEVGAEGLLVSELASKLAETPANIIKTLFMKGIMVTMTQTLDMDTVKVIGLEYGVDILEKDEVEVTDMAKKVEFLDEEDIDNLVLRPPVVTVMGHVDHGKTSLLDYIRKSSVADGEAGGITQAIGAYQCELNIDNEDKMICFLDTPGHEAFSAMRARGAKVTDVAIIIVAADDGLQPQTREAVSHAKAADVPVIVAINKIDKEGANPEKVKQQLGELELIPEEWGGKTPVIPISAKTGEGIDMLLEIIVLMAEVELELMANPDRLAKGTVIEADLDKRAGPIATLLVQNGTLKVGDVVVSGASYGKVRSLTSDRGTSDEAAPSTAVRMLGLDSVPSAGDEFQVYKTEAEAREVAEKAAERIREAHLAEVSGGGSMVTLSSLASMDDDVEGIQRLNIVLRGDTSGAVEAVKSALGQLPQDSVMLRYLHSATGDITESDISLASPAEGVILGYNVEPSDAVMTSAKQKGVEIRSYKVIYDLIDDIRAAMEGRIKSVDEKVPIGTAEVRAVFGSGSRAVAGCMVTEGRLEKGAVIEVRRKKKKLVYEGMLSSLRRVKDVVQTVESGLECGVGCDFVDWEEGDIIEAYSLVEKNLTLEEARAPTAVNLDDLELEMAELEN